MKRSIVMMVTVALLSAGCYSMPAADDLGTMTEEELRQSVGFDGDLAMYNPFPRSVKDPPKWKAAWRDRWIELHPEWDAAMVEAVRGGKVVEGMSDDQLLASWGPPLRVNIKSTPGSREEIWNYRGEMYYSGSGVYAERIYVVNGVVDFWVIEGR